MRFRIIVASNRQPRWVTAGYEEYVKRLPTKLRPELIELPLARRTRGTSVRDALADEGERMLARVVPGASVVALHERGAAWDTTELARRLEAWLAAASPVCLLIGGPDGLSRACLVHAAERWSLSALTLPHGLVRIIVAEALYRAWSVMQRHPYHRA